MSVFCLSLSLGNCTEEDLILTFRGFQNRKHCVIVLKDMLFLSGIIGPFVN